MLEQLSDEARIIVAQEEALLAHVLAVLQAGKRSVRSGADHREQLKSLREEAMEATPSDLPRIFQEMNEARALSERQTATAGPPMHTPYFAHLRLKGRDGSRDYLLGRATFANTTSDVRIVDWRFAPVARIFYSYQEGDEYEEQLPGGLSEGLVEARRIVVIERGVLTRIIAGPLVLARQPNGGWGQERAGSAGLLAGGSGTAARAGTLGTGAGLRGKGRADITALLDPEQFDAVSSHPDRPLLVLGSAGSGKTTVALHRLAKMAFDDRQRFPAARMRVVVPEEGLARLSRRLLAPLGLNAVRVDTLAGWLYRTSCSVFGQQKIKLCLEPPALTSRLKRHPALRKVLLQRMGHRNDTEATLARLRRRLTDLFTDSQFLTEVIEAAQGDLPKTAVETTVRHTMAQIRTPLAEELAVDDPERLKTVDGLSLEEGTPEELSGTCDVEDLALYLFLKTRSGFRLDEVAHLVLDEAEDLSLFELFALGRLLGRKKSCTLAGDEMQQTTSGFAGWSEMLSTMGVGQAATVKLQVSYRCPRPVTELAQYVLGVQAPVSPSTAGRDGVPVGFHHFPDEAQAYLFLAGALQELIDREPNASVGVITSDPETARSLYHSLSSLPQTRLVLDGAFSFDPGVDITDVNSVKGLEFDYVVIPDATPRAYPDDPETRRRLHVAVTRTSHQLWVISSGLRTPILRDFQPSSGQ